MKKILPFRPFLYLIFLLLFALIPIESIINRSFCIYSNLFSFECAGCGVTRGFCAFMHFDFALAYSFNPVFTVAVFPIAIFLMLEDTIHIVARTLFKKNTQSVIEKSLSAFAEVLMAKK